MSDSYLAPVISAFAALAGALGAQWIGGYFNIRAKRLEALFTRKADAYTIFLEKAALFVFEYKEQSRYAELLTAAQQAVIVASPEVADMLDFNPKYSIINAAVGLRMSENPDEASIILMKEWRQKMERLTRAMRDDLQKLN